MKQFSLFIALLLVSFAGYSQITAAGYGFTASSGTYSSISGTGTTVSGVSSDDAASGVLSIGFDFVYCGTTYNSLRANTNGFISLPGSTSSPWTEGLGGLGGIGSGIGVLMPYWDDLYGRSFSTMYTLTSGTSPNRVFTVEWSSWGRNSSSTELCNFQVKLYETTNIIEYAYGTNTFSSPSGGMGIANSATDYQTLNAASSAPASVPSSFTSVPAFPSDGQIYQYSPPPPCSGTIVAGTANADVASACITDNITLTVTGSTVATGLTYQWQASADFITWADIAGATTTPYVTTESADMYYRAIVTCPGSGSFDSTTGVAVDYNPICFCTPSYYYTPATSYGLNVVNMTGEGASSISDAGPTSPPASGYQNRTGISIDLQQGNSYSGTLTYTPGYYYYQDQIWIDFNDDGTFSTTEEVSPVIGSGFGSSYVTSDAYTITIPLTAPVGNHRMRVRNVFTYDALLPHIDPCTSYDTYASGGTYYYGTTRDYTANILAAPACTGTPTGGIATSSSTLACPSTAFTLSATGTPTVLGLTYQWSLSATGATGSYTAIAGATDLTYSYTTATPQYYQLTVTCTASGLSDTSTSVFVNYFGFCYCTPTYYYSPAGSYGYGLTNVAITGYAGSTLSDAGMATPPASGYEDRTSIPAINFQQGNTYPGTLSYGTTSSSFHNMIWIDFNDDGVFATSEQVTPVIEDGSYVSSINFNLTIPLSGATGLHRMRVRDVMTYSSSPLTTVDPCISSLGSDYYYYGQVRDYMANIIAAPACAGTPTAGTAVASTSLGCPSTAFTLTATGYTIASGLTYQWQSSTTGTAGSFTDIAGATDLTYTATIATPTYFHMVITCTASGVSAPSTDVFVNYFGFCYCTPSYYYSPAGSYGYGLTNVAITGYLGSTLSDAGMATPPSNGYEDRTGVAAIDFQQGGTYPGTLSYGTSSSSFHNMIWIDFNDDGTFAASEQVVTPVIESTSYVSSINFNISIPLTAATGLHRMRVRDVMTYSSSAVSTVDPCSTTLGSDYYYYGQTRDYMANIIALPACAGTPITGAASITPSGGGMPSVFTLSMPGLVLASGYTFQWQSGSSATGPWTDIAGATGPTYTFTGISADTWYQAIVTCTASSLSTTATPTMATYVPFPLCLPTGASWSGTTLSPQYGISQFNLTGAGTSTIADLTVQTDAATGSGYLNRAGTVVDMVLGNTYSGTATFNPYSSQQELQVWIDFNDDLVYDTTEEVSPVSGYTSIYAPTPFNVTIPMSGNLGVHNMRVRGIWETYGSTSATTIPLHLDPCAIQFPGNPLHYYSGTVVDYRANILSPCPFTATAHTGGAVCPNSAVSLTATVTGTTTSYAWSGPGGFTSTSLTATAPGIGVTGVYSFTATDGTCTLTLTTNQNLLPAPPIPVVTPSVATICNGSSQTLNATVPGELGNILFEDFNTGLDGWSVDSTGTIYSGGSSIPMQWTTVADGYNYSGTTYHSPTNDSFAYANPDPGGSGSELFSQLISPSFSLAGMASADLDFQNMYYYYYADYTASVDLSTDGGATWNTLYDYVLGGVTVGSPTSFTSIHYALSSYISPSATNCKLRFNYQSPWGIYWGLDNVKVTGTPILGVAPIWTPVADLYTDPAFTTPYVAGTPAYDVYVHPTATPATTTVNYIASRTNGTCLSYDTAAVTINVVPAITTSTGASTICAGTDITLSNPTAGGTWSSSNVTVANINATTGVVHGLTAGTDTMFYTLAGCSSYKVITVSTFVSVTTGTTVLCSGGLTSTLSNPTTGGTWSGGSASVATVSATGVVTTSGVGTTIITYTLPTGCADTSLITSVAPPAAITGSSSVCYNGGTTTLSTTATGGTWSTSAPTVATIIASGSTVTVTGLTSGSATIAYTTLAGCAATVSLTLNANPSAITGSMSVCASGGVTSLSDATTSGTWTSSTPARAVVSSTTGVVTGVTAGTTVITYTATNGCYDTALVTVNALPSAITGTTTICELSSTTLADASTPGTWTTSTPTVTAVTSGGVVTALTSGTGTIIFTQSSTGCTRSATITINALPAAITGATSVCNGLATTFSSTTTGTWSSSTPSIASVEPTTGIVHAASVGTATITLTNGSGCYVTKTITVNSSTVPTVALATTPGTTVCAGTAVSFVPTVTNGGGSPVYAWTVNSLPVATGSSYSYTPVDGDVVALSIVSSLACSVPTTASASVIMTVDPIVTPALTLSTAYGDTGCVGTATTVYAHPVSAGAGATYQWYVNGTPVTGATSYAYVATDGDVISVNMTSTAGCLSGSSAIVTSSTLTLTIVPYVTPEVLMINSVGGSSSCAGNIVVYNTTVTNGGGSPSFVWTVNGTSIATGPSYFYTPSNGDVIAVTMTSSYPCVSPASDSAQMTMTVGSSVSPVAVITVSPGTTVMAGMNDTFSATLISGGGVSPAYQWFINGVPVSGATGTTFVTNTLSTGDLVTVHVTNTDLCGGTSISNILAMTVHGGVGVANVAQGVGEIAMVPNPNNGSFIVKGTLGASVNEDMTLEVTDMLGQIVYTGSTQAKNGDFNEQIKLDGVLANGTYLLHVRSQHMNKVFHFVLEQK